jgi:heme/copper-type cytochrome/quinol oxidase subunit 2
VLLLIALAVSGQSGTQIADFVLAPWFYICIAATPQSWQTQGNILLGMMWLMSGLVVYSSIFGLLFTMLRSFARRPNGSDNEIKATS